MKYQLLKETPFVADGAIIDINDGNMHISNDHFDIYIEGEYASETYDYMAWLIKNHPEDFKEIHEVRTPEVDKVNRLISQSLPEEQKELVSDGYHTFKELYAHRIKLFVALCNSLKYIDEFSQCKHKQGTPSPPIIYRAWKARKHADGTMYDGWFIAGIGTEKGNTLTYHLPMSEWDNFLCPEVGHAPEWDGHTSDDVLNLLYKL